MIGPIERSPWKLPVLSGLLLAFAYFPFGLLIPNLVALIPMLRWIDVHRHEGAASRLRAGPPFHARRPMCYRA